MSLVSFYFGRSVARAIEGKEWGEAAVRSISERAYRDVCRTMHGVGAWEGNRQAKKDVAALLKRFVDGLSEVKSQDDFDLRHEQWCESVISIFTDASSGVVCHYGQVQKWINMALKYFAVLDHPQVRKAYSYLHVPLDRDVLQQAKDFSKVSVPEGVWSKMSKSEYDRVQLAIRDAVSSESREDRKSPKDWKCPMDWEVHAWMQA
ncbi:hypothetical protein [Corynebacterium aquilae]|uniref:hypothetical protein n=1 Tax=Corynebacterium aquilae TaxID=203263 RepID=UPI0012ECF7DD|nr:hypothetical protein [Corynebacterium aquilae]